ncbi:MAG: CHRD domain-containing protein [Pedosphaera sp.]|nr:CHRD domain-containing protein [Pedosphaera sp.]
MKKILLAALLASGLISVQGQSVFYSVIFDGPSESPPNASPGTGNGTVSYDPITHLLTLQASFSGLTGTTTASHIHAATAVAFTGNAGVATTTPTFAGFPLGVTSGTYNNILNLTLASSYNPSYVTAHGGTTTQAELDLTAAMAAGKAYWNIHSTTFGGGEIRGFLVAVPEPGTFALAGLGAIGMAVRVWKNRRARKA